MLQQDKAGSAYCARTQARRADNLGNREPAAGEEGIGNFLDR